MQRLFMLLLTIAMGTMAGIGVIVVLVLGHVGLWPILIGAGTGAILAVPVSWMIARRMIAGEG
ncbi:hypothetical protein [Paracoccus marinaquae]|uniref:CTP synthetase n=1 Tax=Paracoccus marinaquae TaxID=2841926 RepID=A0ABS6AJ42_9RHOB|nr:hypothetical protein [Paracoccus marinaquae]MBU3029917.1 hypothetical protein [Paracoccus marinaquae]